MLRPNGLINEIPDFLSQLNVSMKYLQYKDLDLHHTCNQGTTVGGARQNSIARHLLIGKKATVSLTNSRTRTNITIILHIVQSTVVGGKEISGLGQVTETKKIGIYL